MHKHKHTRTLTKSTYACPWPRHCNTQQHTTTHRNTPQHTVAHATHHNTPQRTVTHQKSLQQPSELCKTLQHTATHSLRSSLASTACMAEAASYNTLQHTATHCNTLQHAATHCNTLQHTAYVLPWPQQPAWQSQRASIGYAPYQPALSYFRTARR